MSIFSYLNSWSSNLEVETHFLIIDYIYNINFNVYLLSRWKCISEHAKSWGQVLVWNCIWDGETISRSEKADLHLKRLILKKGSLPGVNCWVGMSFERMWIVPWFKELFEIPVMQLC